MEQLTSGGQQTPRQRLGELGLTILGMFCVAVITLLTLFLCLPLFGVFLYVIIQGLAAALVLAVKAMEGHRWLALILVNTVAFGISWLVRRKQRQHPEIKHAAGAEPGKWIDGAPTGVVTLMAVVTVGAVGLLMFLRYVP